MLLYIFLTYSIIKIVEDEVEDDEDVTVNGEGGAQTAAEVKKPI